MTLAIGVTWFLFAVTVLMGLTAWLIFWWSVRSGQFRDAEDTAQRMLDHELRDDAGAPGGGRPRAAAPGREAHR
jgi:cbb3-type cytochrome oxidase maturation protein